MQTTLSGQMLHILLDSVNASLHFLNSSLDLVNTPLDLLDSSLDFLTCILTCWTHLWLVVQILARQANTGSDSVPIDLDMNSDDGDGEDGMYNLPMLESFPPTVRSSSMTSSNSSSYHLGEFNPSEYTQASHATKASRAL